MGERTAYEPPTDEQLERFVFALLQGEAYRRGIEINADFGARMVMRNPLLKEAWLQRHRDLAAAIAHHVPLDSAANRGVRDGQIHRDTEAE